MQKAEAQHHRVQNQPAQRQGKGAAFESPQGERIAQLETMATASAQTAAQRRIAAQINASPRMAAQRMAIQGIHNSPHAAAQRQRFDSLVGNDAVQREEADEPLQPKVTQREAAPAKPNDTGLPDDLKSGIESLSGMSMDNVRVHYNSSQPAQLNALAYAQGTDIHVAPGQERHLPHEAWHVVQQAQGRVQPTMQMKEGMPVNDDAGLEREADVMGARALSNGAAASGKMGGLLASSGTAQLKDGVPETEVVGGEESNDVQTRGRSGAVIAVEEPAKQEQKDTDETTADVLAESTNEEGAVTTKSGYEIKPGLPPKEQVELVQKGDEAIAGVSTAGTVASGTKELVDQFSSSKEPAKEGLAIFDKTNSMFGSIVDRVTGFISGLVKPIIDAGLSILGMKEKWGQWNVFKEAAVEVVGGKSRAKPGAPDEAKYGLSKIPSGFMRHVKDVFLHVVEFTSTLLTMIPGAQIVGAPMKLFSMICNLLDSVYKAGKSIYQRIFGEKKDKYSGSLLDKALKGEQPALDLILKLRLDSIAGSGYKALDIFKGKINELSLNNLAHRVGINVTKAERIIDKMEAGSGGPSSTTELSDMLHLVCDGSTSSKELIRAEIKEAMTGFGK